MRAGCWSTRSASPRSAARPRSSIRGSGTTCYSPPRSSTTSDEPASCRPDPCSGRPGRGACSDTSTSACARSTSALAASTRRRAPSFCTRSRATTTPAPPGRRRRPSSTTRISSTRSPPPGPWSDRQRVIAITLALAASLSWGVGDFLGGVSARRLPTFTVMAVSQVAGLAAVVVLAAALAEAPPGTGGIAFAVGAGLGGIVGLAALYRGMAVGAIAIVAPISAAAAVVPLAVGLARGERPAALQLAGVGVVLVGVALTSHELGPGGRQLAAGAGLAVVAALGFGLYYVLIAEAADESALW